MLSLTRVVAIVVMRRVLHCFTNSSGPLMLIVLLSLGTNTETPLNSSSSFVILPPPFPITPPMAFSSTLNLQTATPSPPCKKSLTSSNAACTFSASPRIWSTFLSLRKAAFTSCFASAFLKTESDPPLKSKGSSSESISNSVTKFLARNSLNILEACSICSLVPLITMTESLSVTLQLQPISEQASLTSFPGSPSKNPIILFSIGTVPVWFSATIWSIF
mmetsp:Transcript_17204/g.36287  ORF Transcript_17204/g.36287 Transcript_17204/m.36287 type:complete len:219 (-) Transcript_17204:1626-2282(-)